MGTGLGLSLPLIRRRAVAIGNPANMFLAGEKGVWYDPSNQSTLWQDDLRTVAVTALGQAVGAIDDLSGNGKHATQATATRRPTWQQDGNGNYYLLFDGVDDSLETTANDFTLTDSMTVWAGVHKLTNAANGSIVDLSQNGAADNGRFSMRAPGGGGTFYYSSKGTVLSEAFTTSTTYNAPSSWAATGQSDISNDSASLRLNGALIVSSATDQGTGNYGNHVLYVGRGFATGEAFNGRIYSIIVRGATSTSTDVSEIEQYVADKTGLAF